MEDLVQEEQLDFKKVLLRNHLFGDYDWELPWYQDPDFDRMRMIRGDLRRLEKDLTSDEFVEWASRTLDVEELDIREVVAAILGQAHPNCGDCAKIKVKTGPVIERCRKHKYNGM